MIDAVAEGVEHHTEVHTGEDTLEVDNLVEDNPVVGTLVEGMHLLSNLQVDILVEEAHQQGLVADCSNS